MTLFWSSEISLTDHLFEVAIEINFSQDLLKSWDNLARSLLLSVKALVRVCVCVYVRVICSMFLFFVFFCFCNKYKKQSFIDALRNGEGPD